MYYVVRWWWRKRYSQEDDKDETYRSGESQWWLQVEFLEQICQLTLSFHALSMLYIHCRDFECSCSFLSAQVALLISKGPVQVDYQQPVIHCTWKIFVAVSQECSSCIIPVALFAIPSLLKNRSLSKWLCEYPCTQRISCDVLGNTDRSRRCWSNGSMVIPPLATTAMK